MKPALEAFERASSAMAAADQNLRDASNPVARAVAAFALKSATEAFERAERAAFPDTMTRVAQ